MLQMNLIKNIKGLASKETVPPKRIKGISHKKIREKEVQKPLKEVCRNRATKKGRKQRTNKTTNFRPQNPHYHMIINVHLCVVVNS